MTPFVSPVSENEVAVPLKTCVPSAGGRAEPALRTTWTRSNGVVGFVHDRSTLPSPAVATAAFVTGSGAAAPGSRRLRRGRRVDAVRFVQTRVVVDRPVRQARVGERRGRSREDGRAVRRRRRRGPALRTTCTWSNAVVGFVHVRSTRASPGDRRGPSTGSGAGGGPTAPNAIVQSSFD